jgi:hypothetical protein
MMEGTDRDRGKNSRFALHLMSYQQVELGAGERDRS